MLNCLSFFVPWNIESPVLPTLSSSKEALFHFPKCCVWSLETVIQSDDVAYSLKLKLKFSRQLTNECNGCHILSQP